MSYCQRDSRALTTGIEAIRNITTPPASRERPLLFLAIWEEALPLRGEALKICETGLPVGIGDGWGPKEVVRIARGNGELSSRGSSRRSD